MSFSIYHDFTIKCEMSNVYDGISNPEQLKHWWPLKCSGIPKEGEIYNFNFTDKYDWYAKVSNCKVNEHIYFKLTKSDEDWQPTTFGFDLREKEDGVLVKFWHKDWPNCNAHFKHSSFCWALLLKGLKDYLEKGIIIPFQDRS
ncbi:SRPBCC family protein [Winogradskyella ursingii]|uniref:SRPBCC family protein n=1 Tax=Winogradskyella ursingii TaxID=2686079 RepID=UPI0015CDFE53|nr:SRPBCC domain-containing protein [Winogradskyella ursingii]